MQLRTQHRVHRLRLLGRGGHPGTDGPHRLVGDDDLRDAVRQRVDDHRQLALDDAVGLARLALASVSPTQTMGVSWCASAVLALSATSGRSRRASRGARSGRRSRSGTRTRPASPPRLHRCTRRARGPSSPARPRRSPRQRASRRAGQSTEMAGTPRHRTPTPCVASSSATNVALAARLPFIFQLPTTNLRTHQAALLGWPRLTTTAPACRCAGSTPSAHAPAPLRRPGTPGGSLA